MEPKSKKELSSLNARRSKTKRPAKNAFPGAADEKPKDKNFYPPQNPQNAT